MKAARELFPQIDEIATRQRQSFPEIEDETFWSAYEICKDYSLLHVPGFYNLYQSIDYSSKNRMSGAAVECGCFLGGAAAFMGLMRKRLGFKFDIWLFDTFEGPPIGSTDIFVGGSPIETPALLPNYEKEVKATIAEIVGNTSGYRFIAGLVEDTVPKTRIDEIFLLRLDTDFYSSTVVELKHFYPRLLPGGVLIIDDYGTFQGSRKAVDEYMATLAVPPLLNRIDLGIWAGVKPRGDQDGGIEQVPKRSGRLARLFSR